ncbi:SUMF1/EgtB/PvdO family nonheme iron enzyme [Chloroflexi bacterium TSY]|nr:SUMF1/EgtB/PvdO family nonheme iron enzyme [Chloroflexi bacterium TSY]
MERERRLRLGEDAQRLIDSPLLVRMLLLVHLSQRRLPEHRAELYLRTTETMLWPEYTLDEEAAEQIGRAVGGCPEIHRELVQHLAFAMHDHGSQQCSEIQEEDVRQILCNVTEFEEFVDSFCTLTRLRGTLLVERLGTYQFIHLAFQEFLTARYLVEVERDVEAVVRFFETGRIQDSWWREPALLVTGYLSLTSPRTASQFVQRLARLDTSEQLPPINADIELAGLASAATALLEWLPTEETLRDEVVARIDQKLMSNAEPARRAEVGVLLGRLGDPRPGVDLKDGLPDIKWIEINAGPFLMGSTDEQAEYDDEKPKFTCNLIREPYCISCYPITVAQYSAFVEGGGYEQKEYWTQAGWQWRKENDVIAPQTYSGVYQTLNHPQVGVSWYEAVAFCQWLSSRLGLPVSLPTEAQWERAARHTDGRIYPWGNEFDAKRCNMADTGIGTTSAVGIFPTGNAVCGAVDMAGNILEWCSTLWGKDFDEPDFKYPYDPTDGREDPEAEGRRVLRGGAFDYNEDGVRCAFRLRDTPDNCRYYVGLRVVRHETEREN